MGWTSFQRTVLAMGIAVSLAWAMATEKVVRSQNGAVTPCDPYVIDDMRGCVPDLGSMTFRFLTGTALSFVFASAVGGIGGRRDPERSDESSD